MDTTTKVPLSAFVFGYTGGVGKTIVKTLARDPRFTKVSLFGRRIVDLENPLDKNGVADYTKFTQEVIDFEKLSEYSDKLQGFDVGICTLGLNPMEVDNETFKRMLNWRITIAKLAKETGCKHFHSMSGFLVNKNSWFAFARTAATVEESLVTLDFPRLSIYKPGVILADGGMVGATSVSIWRFLDRWHWMSVEVECLAKFVVENTFKKTEQKIEILSNSEINCWAKANVKK